MTPDLPSNKFIEDMERCAFCKIEETMLYESGVPVCLKCVDRRNTKSKADQADIYAALVRALADATLRAESANREFDAVRGDIPSALPQPDGTQRIHNASRALNAARDEMMKAHKRLEDYLGRGIVPDDLT
ncbi:MAG: hypothetical protein M3N41_12535 [Acidobacteriota bacterium]|nr:hypothetical protein [Acidobacteriota bacterium]